MEDRIKQVVILGSTGSIGTQALEVMRQHRNIKPIAIAAYENITLLEQQIREFHPQYACVYVEEKALELKSRVADCDTKIVSKMEGLLLISTLEQADIVLTALVGMIGIRPTIAAIQAKKDIALANKETLVTAGHIIMPLAKEKNVQILPVDSEHSAIFQSLNGEKQTQIEKILLTASGGPFRGKSREELQQVTREDALRHPNWSMGKKITIDSATMVNKGLEVIEAKWLFQVPVHKIQVVVQPQSVIHSMVQFVDGAVMAQMGTADMKLPIQYALTYPSRKNLKEERLDFFKLGQITFEAPDLEVFTGLKMAYQVGERADSYPTVYNAANEFAVKKFLEGKISFLTITDLISYALKEHKAIDSPSVEEILQVEQWVYELLEKKCKK